MELLDGRHKKSLKKTLQHTLNVDLGILPIEDICDFFIHHLKDYKPKLLDKSDVEWFDKIDSNASKEKIIEKVKK